MMTANLPRLAIGNVRISQLTNCDSKCIAKGSSPPVLRLIAVRACGSSCTAPSRMRSASPASTS